LKEERGSCVSVTESSDTWSETAGIKEKKKRGKSFPKISLRC